MSTSDITAVVMGATALFATVYGLFTTRQKTEKLTAGSDATSWGDLVRRLYEEMDRREERCQEEIEEGKRECERRIDRNHRLAEVRATRANRLLVEAATYSASLERRILDMTVGGLSSDLARELEEHRSRLKKAQDELGGHVLPE